MVIVRLPAPASVTPSIVRGTILPLGGQSIGMLAWAPVTSGGTPLGVEGTPLIWTFKRFASGNSYTENHLEKVSPSSQPGRPLNTVDSVNAMSAAKKGVGGSEKTRMYSVFGVRSIGVSGE